MKGKKFKNNNGCATRIRKNNGFTLLEILMAVVILTIGLLGTAALLRGVIYSDKLSNEMSVATTLAKDRIEDLRQVGYLGAPSVGSPVTEDPVTGFADFTRVTTASSTGVDGAKALTVTVTYRAFGTHTVELKTILSR
jgi:prepilin-type N-terminal cleavage/methylation domain-containing protein